MKDPLPIKIHTRLPTEASGIMDYLEEVLIRLKEHATISEAALRKIKLVIVELVTNSIKHSSDENALLEFTFNHPTLTIQKVDKGLQIEFVGESQQIPFVEMDKTIEVSFSENKNQHIKIIDKYQFKFLDAYKEGINVNYLPEHFGLYIITLASDSFIYQHDPTLMENRFIVNINL